MAKGDDALDVLRSIDASLKQLVAFAQKRQAVSPKAVASDADLDGKWGDPVLKFMPRDWTGASFKQCHFSQCPAELLDLVAQSCDYFGDQAEKKGEMTDKGEPVADYKRSDAARARGWAKRIRAGHVAVPPAGNGQPASDEWGATVDDGF